MAKQTRKEKVPTPMDWVRANEKVLIVVLLALVGFTFAFGDVIQGLFQGSAAGQFDVGFGENIGQEEFGFASRNVPEAARAALYAGVLPGGVPTQTMPFLFMRDGKWNPGDYFFYRAAARDAGIRVSDAELDAARRKIWRQWRAQEQTRAKLQELGVQPSNDPSAQRAYSSLFQSHLEEFETALENQFDAADWPVQVKRRTPRLRSEVYEELLRDVIAVARLEASIRAGVQISKKEVYEKFRADQHRRRAEWVELVASDALKAAITASLSDDDLRAYWDENKEDPMGGYQSPVRARFQYLRGSIDHFRAEAEKKVEDADVRKEYDNNLKDYARPDIRTDTGAFALRTPEEKEARTQELYLPFDEVSDKVREAAVSKTALADMSDFARKLKSRLYPSQPASADAPKIGGEGATFADLAAEYEFLETATTDYVTQQDAEEKLGEDLHGAVRFQLSNWLRSKSEDAAFELDDKALKQLRTSKSITKRDEDGGKSERVGFVYVAGVDLQSAGTQPFEEAREQVAEDLLNSKLAELLGTSIDAKIEDVVAGKLAFADLAGSEVEIALDGEAKAPATFSAVETAPTYLRKWSRIMVPKAPEEDDPEKKDDNGDDAEEDELPIPEEEAHASSRDIVTALFTIDETGNVVAARDEKGGRVYVVSYAGRQEPDAGDFERSERNLRGALERDAFDAVFAEWRTATLEASGLGAAADEPPAEGEPESSAG